MIKLPAIFSGFSSRADKSAGVRFATQELDGDDFKELQNLNGTFGWLLFKENSLPEIPKEDAEDRRKSQSSRMRNVLFAIFKQKFPEKKDFQTYYRMRMEGLIEKLKEELES